MTTTDRPNVEELDAARLPGDDDRPQTRFVPRKTAPPVRQTDMIQIDDDDVDPDKQGTDVSEIDSLEELLGLDTEREIHQTVDMLPELKGKYIVQALDNDIHQEIIEECTYWQENPRTHEQVRQMDNQEFTRRVVFRCLVTPDLNTPALFKKYNVSMKKPDRLVAKIFLPGQVDRLFNAIWRISGFRDDLVAIAKNSSRKED